MMLLFYVVTLVAGLLLSTQSTRYDGHKVLKVFPKTTDEKLKTMNLILSYGLDIWRRDPDDKSLAIHVKPEMLPSIKVSLKKIGVEYSIWIPNIQTIIDKQHSTPYHTDTDLKDSHKNASQHQHFFTKYHTFSEISVFINNLTNKLFYGPSGNQIFVVLNEAGRTYERNPIHMLKIYKPGSSKKAIFVEGGIHAREWISPAFVLFLINELVTNPSRSPEIENLVDAFDWYIVPVLNPDGYIYTHIKDRLWRKNRRQLRYLIRKFPPSKHSKKKCVGVDVNRNFGYKWKTESDMALSKPCSQLFAGKHPFSELESSAVRDIVLDKAINFSSYLSFHSYGLYWMYPWGYTSEYPADVRDLETGAKIATQALRRRYNTTYVIDSVYNALYPASGVSIDYTKAIAGIKYSYSVELRDKNQFGFLLPRSEIIPTCLETMDAVKAFVQFLKSKQGNHTHIYRDIFTKFYRNRYL